MTYKTMLSPTGFSGYLLSFEKSDAVQKVLYITGKEGLPYKHPLIIFQGTKGEESMWEIERQFPIFETRTERSLRIAYARSLAQLYANDADYFDAIRALAKEKRLALDRTFVCEFPASHRPHLFVRGNAFEDAQLTEKILLEHAALYAAGTYDYQKYVQGYFQGIIDAGNFFRLWNALISLENKGWPRSPFKSALASCLIGYKNSRKKKRRT